MSGRVIKIVIGTILIAAIVSYIYILNPASVELSVTPGKTTTQPLALILIFAFGAGALLISLFVMLIGIKGWLHRKQEARRIEQAEKHKRQLISARERSALGDYRAAAVFLAKIIQKDPDDIVARIQLAEAHRKSGDLKTALEILEEARVEQRQNVELLLLASDLNAELGNHTAAHDNAALVLKLIPKNTFALERLAASSSALERYEQAADYQRALIKLSSANEQEALQQGLAELELKAAQKDNLNNLEGLTSELQQIIKRHRDFAPALEALAAIEKKKGQTDAAAKFYLEAFQSSKKVSYLEKSAMVWLRADNPQKALSLVTSALKKKGGDCETVEGSLFFSALLLHLEMREEASEEINKIKPECLNSEPLKRAYTVLHARLLRRDGKLDEAFECLIKTLARGSFLNRGLLLGESLQEEESDQLHNKILANDDTENGNVFTLSTP